MNLESKILQKETDAFIGFNLDVTKVLLGFFIFIFYLLSLLLFCLDHSLLIDKRMTLKELKEIISKKIDLETRNFRVSC